MSGPDALLEWILRFKLKADDLVLIEQFLNDELEGVEWEPPSAAGPVIHRQGQDETVSLTVSTSLSAVEKQGSIGLGAHQAAEDLARLELDPWSWSPGLHLLCRTMTAQQRLRSKELAAISKKAARADGAALER